MPTTPTNESKNSASVTNDSKTGAETTWDEADFPWDESGGMTWNNPGTPVRKDSKNSASVTNESKT